MSAISDFLNSAFSELFYEREQQPLIRQPQPVQEPQKKEQKEPFKRKVYDSIPETISTTGSLVEFDRVLGMLESNDNKVKTKAIVAIEGMSDENRLACIAIFSKNADARKAALNLVQKKPSVLAVVYSESLFNETKEEAISAIASMIEAIKDEKVLAILSCNHRDKRIRMRALGAIREIKWLLDIAYGSKYEDSRWEAIEQLRSMNVDIDREDLRHDDTLSDLADQLVKSSTSEEEVMHDMEIMLDNVHYLQNTMKSKKNDEFADIIHDNLSAYINILKNIATSSRHTQARELAITGIEDDPALMAEVAQHAEYEDTTTLAVEKIAGLINSKSEPQCLALVASMSEVSDKRARAVSKLDNAQMLKYVIKFSKYDDSRITAAHKLASMINELEDAESLRLVIAYAKESKNRELAEKRIAELEGKIVQSEDKKPIEAVKEDNRAIDRKAKTEPKPSFFAPSSSEEKEEKVEIVKPKPSPSVREESESVQNLRSSNSNGGLWASIKELIGI